MEKREREKCFVRERGVEEMGDVSGSNAVENAVAKQPRVAMTKEDVAKAFQKNGDRRSRYHETAAKKYKAFYSSVYGGFVTDYALMAVPMDDHMVHRYV